MTDSRPRGIAWKVALAYGVVGGLWILFSDRLVSVLVEDAHTLSRIQTVKGWVYVGVTMLVLYAFLSYISERIRRYEDSLRESEARYRSLFDRVPINLYRTTPGGQILYVNPALLDLLGCADRGSLLQSNVLSFYVQPDDRVRWQAAVDQAGTLAGFEAQIRRADGRIIWVRDTARVLRDDRGRVLYYEGSMEDITTRKQAESALADSEARYRALFDQANDFIVVLQDGVYVDCNKHALQLLGLSDRSEVIGKFPADLSPEYQPDGTRSDVKAEAYFQIANQGVAQTFEWQHKRADGTLFNIEVRLGQITVHTGPVLLALGRDMTGHKQAEEALAAERNLLRTLIDNLPDLIYIKDTKGRHLIDNIADAQAKGAASPDEVLGKTDFDFFPEELAVHYDADDQRVVATGVPMINHEEMRLDENGEPCWILTTKVPLRNSEGEVIGLVGVGREITRRKRAEAERERLLKLMELRATEMETVAEVSRQITTILDVDQLLWAICNLVRENFGLYHVHIYLLDQENNRLDLSAGSGTVGQQLVANHHSIPLMHEISLVAQAARTQAAVVANNVNKHPSFMANPLLPYTRSELAIPMIVGQTLVGVLDVQSDTADYFTAEDVSIKTALAAQLAIAIENARLFTENARRLAIIEKTNSLVSLARVGDSPVRVLYINPAGVRLLGYTSEHEVLHRPISDFYPAEDVVTLRHKVMPEVLSRGYWSGEWHVQRRDGTLVAVEQTVFTIPDNSGQARYLATIVTDISERKHAEEALKRANRAYRTLSDSNQAMIRAADEYTLLQTLCDIIIDSGRYKLAWVGMPSPSDPGMIALSTVAGPLGEYTDLMHNYTIEIDSSLTLTGMAYQTRQPQVIQEIVNFPNYARWKSMIDDLGFGAAIALPLLVGDQIYGVLSVYAGEPFSFDTEELALLDELAGDIAYGIMALRTSAEREQAVERLAQSEANLSALVENTHDVIWSVDRDYKLLTVNSTFVDEFARDFEINLKPGLRPIDYMPDTDWHQWDTYYTRALAGEQFIIEQHIATQPERDVELSFNPIMGSDGAITGVSIFGRDITERKTNEKQLRQLNTRLAKRNRELMTISEIGHKLTATFDINQIFRMLYREVVNTLLDTPHFTVALFDPDTQMITCEYLVIDGQEADPSALPAIALNDSPNSQAIRTRQPLIVDLAAVSAELESHGHLLILASDERRPQSALYVPLISQDQVIGVVSVQHYDAHAYQESDSMLLSIVASQAATAIHNARLFEAERDQRTLAEALRDTAATINSTLNFDEALDRILANVGRVMPHDAANIMLIEGDRARAVRAVGYTEHGLDNWLHYLRLSLTENNILHQMVVSREPYVIPDIADDPNWQHLPETEWQVSYAAVPICREDQVMGFLNVYSRTPHFFTVQHAERLSAFADQAAVAIHNARLFEAERDQRALAEALRDTAAAIGSTLELEEVLTLILENVGRVVPHNAANVMLIDQSIAHIAQCRGYDRYGHEEWVRNWRRDIHEVPTWQDMFETGQPFAIFDTRLDPRWMPREEESWIRSTVKAPIKINGEIIGILHVDSEMPGAFTTRHVEQLQLFADQAAIAIRNARLFAAERDQRALAEALRDTASAVSSTLDFDEVLDRILENVGRVVPHDAANIIQIEEDMGYIVRGRGYNARGLDQWIETIHFDIQKFPMLARFVRAGIPSIIPDVWDDPDWVDIPEVRWIRSLASIPVLVGDNVLGLLHLDSHQPEAFTPAHLDRLQVFADQASIAIRNAQLFAAERDQRTLAEALSDTAATVNNTLDFEKVLDRILENAERIAPHDTANIMFIEGDSVRIVRSRGYAKYGLDEWIKTVRFDASNSTYWPPRLKHPVPTLIGETHQHPDWHAIPETVWIHSFISVPISRQGEVIGFLNLDSETPFAFGPRHLKWLQAFADQVAVAINNAQLFAAERDQRALAEALRDTAAAVNSTLDFDTVLDRILENVGRIAAHDAATIMLIQDGVARVVRSNPLPEEDISQGWVREVTFDVDTTPNLNTMAGTQRPLAISDTQTTTHWVKVPSTEWIRSQAAAPIRQGDQVIGFLTLESRTPGFFTQDQAERLQAFADQVAIALDNARLFDTVQRHAAELEQRVRERTAELEAQGNQLKVILDTMGEALVYSVGAEVAYVNRAAESLTGFSFEEVAQEAPRVFEHVTVPTENLAIIQEKVQRAFARGQSWRGEMRMQQKDGTIFDASLTASQVSQIDDDTLRRMVVIFHDISQEKELQTQKDRFIANASHELRTPLANLKTRLYLLKNQPEKSFEHLKILERVTDSMADLVENLLDVSRFERGVIPLIRQQVSLHHLIHDVIAVQTPEAERRHITLHAEFPDEPVFVAVDSRRIMQVITNLVTNAINYTPEGGRVWVQVSHEESPAGPQAVIRVRDTGIGIAPETLAQIFEPFFRANTITTKGTGLGLTIAREIIALHGGEISVESEVGKGSVFIVRLNLADKEC